MKSSAKVQVVTNKNSIPFLRWAGGKRWLAHKLSPFLHQILTENNSTYVEPFLGAGAMFFDLAPQKSILSDLNQELIETYLAVRDYWEQIEQTMKGWEVSRETYYKIRKYKPRTKINKAARFIWLNRTCYGGLYRVNRDNEFNVPFGGGSRTPQIIYQNQILKRASEVLQFSSFFPNSVKIIVSDFEPIISKAKEGDVVYCDPTYSNVKRGQFDRYGRIIFNWEDQKRLANISSDASNRGATVIISNGYFSDLLKLYSNAYRMVVSKPKTIGNRPGNNIRHKEYLFILDKKRKKKFWNKLALQFSCKLY